MKVKIEHIANTYNYGSMMMAINLILGIVDKHRNVEFFVDANTLNDVDRLIKATGYSNIKLSSKEEDTEKQSSRSKFMRLLSAPLKIMSIRNKAILDRGSYDILLVIGGDDLSEYYGTIAPLVEAFRYNLFSKKIKTILVGQTIGPFTSYRKSLISHLLDKKNIMIYTRDSKTYEYLTEEMNMKNISSSKDLAFLDLPYQNDLDKLNLFMKNRNLATGEYITIVPSGLFRSYCSDQEIYYSKMTKLIESMCENEKFKDMKIVILAHVVNSGMSDDRNTIKHIRNNIKPEYLNKLLFVEEELLPHEARYILGNGLLTITGRMHAAISTFQCGKPAISLSYSVKYEGVIGRGLNMRDLIIESAGDEYWLDDYILRTVNDKVDYVFENYTRLCMEIDKNILECKENVLNMIDEINTKIA